MVDHINRDGLDNRKCNLRLVNPSQSAHNRKIRSDNRSGYKGVQWRNDCRMWIARFCTDGKRICCGYFKEAEKAAMAYDKIAFKMIGAEAQLNFPERIHLMD